MIEHSDGYDDTIPTPEVARLDDDDPNPADGNLPDAPPSGGPAADGAVDDQGRMLTADGTPAPPKGGDA